jgi:ribosomal protein L37E
MEPITITCDACGRTAFVHHIHYQYADEHLPGQPASEHRLFETQWEIDCPRCGVRTQSQKDGSSQSGIPFA